MLRPVAPDLPTCNAPRFDRRDRRRGRLMLAGRTIGVMLVAPAPQGDAVIACEFCTRSGVPICASGRMGKLSVPRKGTR